MTHAAQVPARATAPAPIPAKPLREMNLVDRSMMERISAMSRSPESMVVMLLP
ncbi:MAG: hypothetical protein IPI01_17895 [Ignavibacteriae bacterium]|nr:hypothetical protein [Ignavibacteriota bacterium]